MFSGQILRSAQDDFGVILSREATKNLARLFGVFGLDLRSAQDDGVERAILRSVQDDGVERAILRSAQDDGVERSG